jgi:hypothetical protein
VFPTCWELLMHVEQGHILDVVQCWLCENRFTSGQLLLQHLLESHLGDQPDGLSCPACRVVFNSWPQLKHHSCATITPPAAAPADMIVPTAASVWTCSDAQCKRTFQKKTAFISHMKSHAAPWSLPRPQLGSQKPELVRLIELENGYTCRICEAHFEMFELLMEHFRSAHPAERAFTCHLCFLAERSGCALKIHLIRQHSLVHAFTRCTFCTRLFVGKKELVSHLRDEHTPLGKLVCRICGLTAENELEMGKNKKL